MFNRRPSNSFIGQPFIHKNLSIFSIAVIFLMQVIHSTTKPNILTLQSVIVTSKYQKQRTIGMSEDSFLFVCLFNWTLILEFILQTTSSKWGVRGIYCWITLSFQNTLILTWHPSGSSCHSKYSYTFKNTLLTGMQGLFRKHKSKAAVSPANTLFAPKLPCSFLVALVPIFLNPSLLFLWFSSLQRG